MNHARRQADHDTAIAEIYSRLGDLETINARLATGQEHLGAAVRDLADVVGELRADIADSKRTDWKTLGTWAGVTVAMISVGVGLTIAPLYRVAELAHTIIEKQASEIVDARERIATLEERARWLEKANDQRGAP